MTDLNINKEVAGVAIAAVADKPLSILLAQTGIYVDIPTDIRAAEASIESLCERNVGLIIVQEDYRNRFSERFKEKLSRRKGLPILFYCPNFDTPKQDLDHFISEVIRPAIGYEIRLD